MIRPLVFGAVISLFASAATAKGTFFDCDMSVSRADGWVSPKLGIIFDGTGGVQVIDAVILNFVGEPIPARATRRGDMVRLTWQVSNLADSVGNRVPTFRYEARLDLKKRAVSVVAKPVGPPQRWSAKGTCITRKNFKGLRLN